MTRLEPHDPNLRKYPSPDSCEVLSHDRSAGQTAITMRGELNPETGEISLNLDLNSKTGEKSPNRELRRRASELGLPTLPAGDEVAGRGGAYSATSRSVVPGQTRGARYPPF